MPLKPISANKLRHLHIFTVVLGLLWMIATIECVQFRRIQARKLHSSPEPGLDDNFSNEDLHKILTLLQGSSKEASPKNGDDNNKKSFALEHSATMIMPELMRIRPQSTTTTTPNPPVSRITTRRFYRRLRRKTTTSTEAPFISSSSSTERVDQTSVASAESPRLLQSGPSPSDLLHQLSLLNGILGALNSSAQTATPTPIATRNANDNNNNNNATPVPDLLAFLTGAKSIGEASTNHETVVPPPPSPTSAQVEDPTAALALLNLFSGGNSQRQDTSSSNNNNNNNAASSAAANLLELVAQAQNAPQPSPTSAGENDAAAALTKLLLGSASAPAMQGNSINQPQNQNAEASANQLNNLLGLLGTLGGAAQQPQAGGINNLFNLGGDQMAQAQTNSLATLFGSQQQTQQQSQAQNLLNLFGGNQGSQGLSLASLLAPQAGNSIPGLGLLSTVSGIGSSIFSTVSNLFGGSNGKPTVRGKGVDTRVGLGYRLGNVGDAQMVWEIGPQLYTDPLRNEARPYQTKKRESGLPAASHYFQPASTTAAEKEMQQIEAKRRMVQAAIQDHYRGNHFQSAYPQPNNQRRRSHLEYNHFDSLYPSAKATTPSPTTSSQSSSSFFSALPFGDHLRGFWSGITSGITGDQDEATSHYNFDDVRSDFSSNLIKRSSVDYRDYESRASHPRRLEEDVDDPTHSTLTEYERMLLQYGKDIGVANTKHGVVDDEPQSNESQSFFSRWFKGSSSPTSSSKAESQPSRVSSPWAAASDEYPSVLPSNISPRPRAKPGLRQSHPPAASPYDPDLSYTRRNDVPNRANPPRRNGGGQRPQKRRSHNPFRNWFSSFKSSGQRSRHGNHQTGGFDRRHFKRPSASNNPKLRHFTNTNKDLMMADANDDFVESAGSESHPVPAYQQPLAYEYADEFPDVPLTPPSPRRRQRPSQDYNKVRASLTQRQRIIEPALLFDHLEATDNVVTEADESFHNRNKVVVNPALREIEKQKVLTATKTSLNKAAASALTKAQRISILKARHNATKLAMAAVKQRVIVKNRRNTINKRPPSSHSDLEESGSESSTASSVMSTISSIFKGTTKPKLLNSLLHNATSFLPSIRILPRKKNKDENKYKTKLTLQNGKPSIYVPMNHDDDDNADEDGDAVDDMDTAADDVEPVVQVGHDMSFTDLQSLFGAGKKNSTKKRKFRIRVKESVLKGEDKERKGADDDDDDEDNDGEKDIFVDIESGEVSVLKPVASLVSFTPKKEEASDEEETDYYEDDDGDGVPDADMKRKEHIFEAIQKQLVNNFEKMKKAQQKAEAKKRRKQELAEKGMDESMDVVTKFFDIHQNSGDSHQLQSTKKPKQVGGLSLEK